MLSQPMEYEPNDYHQFRPHGTNQYSLLDYVTHAISIPAAQVNPSNVRSNVQSTKRKKSIKP